MTHDPSELSAVGAYWDERARQFAASDPEGWAAVCHRDAPQFFNAFIDWSQRLAVTRLLDAAPRKTGAATDIGCGTGRWAAELARRGYSTAGFDVSPAMVERARDLNPGVDFDVAPATALPLGPGTQDLVTCITVLHHLPPEEQEAAVAEIARVLAAGGACAVIVLRNILPGGAWCFPRSRGGWDALFARHGLQPALRIGEEYLTPATLLQYAAAATKGLLARRSRPTDSGAGRGEGLGGRAYRALHRAAVRVSYPLEQLGSERIPGAPALGHAALYVKHSAATSS